jgi:hypothetical protein
MKVKSIAIKFCFRLGKIESDNAYNCWGQSQNVQVLLTKVIQMELRRKFTKPSMKTKKVAFWRSLWGWASHVGHAGGISRENFNMQRICAKWASWLAHTTLLLQKFLGTKNTVEVPPPSLPAWCDPLWFFWFWWINPQLQGCHLQNVPGIQEKSSTVLHRVPESQSQW